MSYKIRNISYSNLKYVGMKEINLELSNNLVLLDGPNGYGKSTVFDAIELLLTGEIEHSAKGKLIALANRKDKDIAIKGILQSDEEEVKLKRIIEAESQFVKHEIWWNNSAITQEELFLKLGFNKSTMGVAIYVSQLKSLSYLEKTVKNRKIIVADLIDNKKNDSEVKCLEDFKNKLHEKIQQEETSLNEKLKNENEIKEKLSKQIENINKIQKKKGYERLFPERDYDFDREQLDKKIHYIDMIRPLEDIKNFLENYNQYRDSKRNLLISKTLKLTTDQLKSFYYHDLLESINGNLKLYQNIEKLQEMMIHKNVNDISEINQILSLTEKEKQPIESIIEKKKNLETTSSKNETHIINLSERRKELFSAYQEGIESQIWEKDICPFCGQKDEKIEKLFLETEEALKESNKVILDDLQHINSEIDKYFEIRAAEVENLIKEHSEDYKNYQRLKNLLKINIGSDEKVILEEKKFYFDSVGKAEFEESFLALKNSLEEEQRAFAAIFEDELIVKYDNILKEYYSDRNQHMLEQINDKIAYIADYYSDDYQNILTECCERIKDLQDELTEKQKSNTIMIEYTDKYIDTYKKAHKEYQTKLVERIKVPLYVYSGKVIQNYPMGLGVIARIKASQIVFETEKKDDDVFEYLSAGQLNGVMLSIMLAVRSVLDLDESINLIMIDDPLQTIDDISAFSYADLLAEQFGDAQIILSTHETDKSDLLEFKFRQHGREIIKYNMHNNYLADV